jgi:hypothetical protein
MRAPLQKTDHLTLNMDVRVAQKAMRIRFVGRPIETMPSAVAFDRMLDRMLETAGLAVMFAFAVHSLVMGRARSKWGRELSPKAARFWGAFGIVMIFLCVAKVWGFWSP